MKFIEKEDVEKFLEDEPFFKNNDCYCLGNSLEEAGEIVEIIVQGQGE